MIHVPLPQNILECSTVRVKLKFTINDIFVKIIPAVGWDVSYNILIPLLTGIETERLELQ